MNAKRIESGDRVSFRSRRGTVVTGTVARIRVKKRKGRARELAFAVTGDETSLDREVAEITPDDGKAVWTVGLGDLTYLGAGDRREALAKVGETKGKIAGRKAERRGDNFETADEAGLYDLKSGDPVMVEFRGGVWYPAIFDGFVAGSGNVRFLYMGRKKTCSPKFVRKPKISG